MDLCQCRPQQQQVHQQPHLGLLQCMQHRGCLMLALRQSLHPLLQLRLRHRHPHSMNLSSRHLHTPAAYSFTRMSHQGMANAHQKVQLPAGRAQYQHSYPLVLQPWEALWTAPSAPVLQDQEDPQLLWQQQQMGTRGTAYQAMQASTVVMRSTQILQASLRQRMQTVLLKGPQMLFMARRLAHLCLLLQLMQAAWQCSSHVAALHHHNSDRQL